MQSCTSLLEFAISWLAANLDGLSETLTERYGANHGRGANMNRAEPREASHGIVDICVNAASRLSNK